MQDDLILFIHFSDHFSPLIFIVGSLKTPKGNPDGLIKNRQSPIDFGIRDKPIRPADGGLTDRVSFDPYIRG